VTIFEEYDDIDDLAIYEALTKTWGIAAIDRQPTWREAVLAPIYEGYAPTGAALFISIMAYPNDVAKQEAFNKTFVAWRIKTSAPPKSPERLEVRKYPELSWALDIPNKRIQQKFSDCSRQVNKRFRAAWVLLQKMASNPDPALQTSLQELILKAAAINTHAYPAFFSEKTDPEDQKEIISDSFRRQILYTAKPVIHLAMAFYLLIETSQSQKISLFDKIQNADQWLKKTLIAAEKFRVLFGDMFPRHDTQYKGGERIQNYAAPMTETIAILPFIDPVESYMDYKWFLHNSREFTKTLLP